MIVKKLQVAKEALVRNPEIVDKTQLKVLFEDAKDKEEKLYTPKSYAALKEIFEDIDTILHKEEASQEEVDDAVSRLQEALDQLVNRADKTQLVKAINECLMLQEENYTSESWSKLQDQINATKEVLTNDDVTQDEVDQMLAKVTKTKEELITVSKTVDTTQLKATLKEVKGLDEKLYTPDSFAPLKEVMKEAETVLENKDVTQDSVDAILSKLLDAKAALVEKHDDVDTSKLEELIKSVEGLKEDAYTSQTWKNLMEAFKQAQELLSNPEITQEEVNQVYETLEISLKNLEESKHDQTDITKGEDSTSAKESSSTRNNDNTNTSTGFNVGLLMTLLSSAGIGIIGLIKKMKSTNTKKRKD